jgi:hypothetical protein
VNGRDLIPHEIKSLTAAGKLAVKPMPKARFHEIYQDYVCACVLRLAREMLALLPIETVLLTATVDGIDLRIGHAAELPVLSMAVPRAVVERLDFEHLDPSAALENFPHRGDVSASKKSDAFVAIAPLRLEEIAIAGYGASEFASLTASVRRYHTELGALLKSAASEPPREGESTDLSF